jgi:thimet oligopeptidase
MSINEKDPIAAGLTAEGITKLCDDGLAEAARHADSIRVHADATDSELTWEATFGAFDGIAFALQEAVLVPQLLRVCHSNAAVREAALACEPRIDAFTSALYTDDAIADVLKRAAARLGALPNPRGRFIEHVLRHYRRNGLELPAEQRKRLTALNEQLTALVPPPFNPCYTGRIIH